MPACVPVHRPVFVITAEVGDEAGRAVIRLLALESDAVWNLLELEEAVVTGISYWWYCDASACPLAPCEQRKLSFGIY